MRKVLEQYIHLDYYFLNIYLMNRQKIMKDEF